MKQTHFMTSGIICFLTTILSISGAQAQAKNGYTIKSGYNHKIYQLMVSLPKNYSERDTVHYPVLYVLDGKFSFASFYSIRAVLDLGREMKDIIIVAIDDRCYTDADWFASRYFDYTPSNVPTSDSQWTKMMKLPAGSLKSGGAGLFLSTLQNDIIPFIDKHYKTSADRGLSGHSLGGLFAGYCLVKNPELFSRYGINSPSFWWNGNEVISLENLMANQHKSLSAKVFISAGALEEKMMLSSITAFTNSLKSHDYKDLTMTSQIFEGETHLSVVPACSSRTLRVLYGSTAQ